jgi:ABC-type bacteriocin/lantibiotic exporter with double-glycine peptidase domain
MLVAVPLAWLMPVVGHWLADADVEYVGGEDVIPQQRVNDCGLVAIAMLGDRIGLPIDLTDLEANISIEPTGLTMLEVHDIAAAYGLRLKGVFIGPRNRPSWRTPWIAHLRSGNGHYVVVERHDDSKWTIADPGRGRVRYSEAAFAGLWSGYALVLDIGSATTPN